MTGYHSSLKVKRIAVTGEKTHGSSPDVGRVTGGMDSDPLVNELQMSSLRSPRISQARYRGKLT